jgi:hypothetical protein
MNNRIIVVLLAVCALVAGAGAQLFREQSETLGAERRARVARGMEAMYRIKFSADQRARMEREVQRLWDGNEGPIREQINGILDGLDQLEALPARTRDLATKSSLLEGLLKMHETAKQGDVVSIIVMEAYHANHKPILPQDKIFTPLIADILIDAYLFHGELMSGKPAPRLGEASREQLRQQLARDYVRAEKAERERIIAALGKITVAMIQWPNLQEYERLLVRADIGAPLSMQEREMAQQIRHQIQGHTLRMMTNELNFMRDSQQTIMGSAPYWNPAANRWEQKGGIVTEFR